MKIFIYKFMICLFYFFIFKRFFRKSSFKIVISTIKSYSYHCDKLLNSIDYTNHLNDIILVYADEDEFKLKNTKELPSIYSKLNLWEYTSFIEVNNYKHLNNFKSDHYFFLHDTCWCDDHIKFWKNLNVLAKQTKYFYYPSTHLFQNIGMCSNTFLHKLSTIYKQHGNFNRDTGVKLERSITKNCKFQYINIKVKRLGAKCINGKYRQIRHFPFIDLYKHSRDKNSNNNSYNGK